MSPQKKTIPEKIWNFFTSLKLTIFLLITLSIASIFGTVIPQNAAIAHYLKIYTNTTYRIFATLGFLDLYHSWWFSSLLLFLALNLIACSSNRFPSTWKRLRQKKINLDEDLLKSLPFKENFVKKTSLNELKEEYSLLLEKTFTRPVAIHSEKESHFLSEKGKYSILGVYMVHFSILLILLGGILGNFLGYEGYVELTEGEARDGIYLKDSNNFKQLGFSVRCDDFEVSFYDNSQQPKDYKSTLTVIDQGKEVLTKTIEVNHPMKYKGIFFYQANYGTTSRKGDIVLSVTSGKGEAKEKKYQVGVGESFEIEGTNTRVKVNRFVPDFMIDGGKVASRSDRLVNPAVELIVWNDKMPRYSAWIFQKHPDFHGAGPKNFDFKFLEFKGRQYTGLQVAKDPGVAVVWSGCSLLLLGIMITFFISHRRIWIKISTKDNRSLITLAGGSNKNQEVFEKEFLKLAKLIKKTEK